MAGTPDESSAPGTAAVGVDVDALLLVTFGGPEGPEDVVPFLRNVTRGREVPEERIAEVAEHYQRLGGRSPINDQSRELLAALRAELAPLPVYWGNRNWRPYLRDALAEMRADGVRRAACFVPSVFATYSGCRQYREDLAGALAEPPAGGHRVSVSVSVSDGDGDGDGDSDGGDAGLASLEPDRGLELVKLRVFFDHPGFVGPMVDRVAAAVDALPAGRRGGAHLVFVAHSVPRWQAVESGPAGGAYERQLTAASELVVRGLAERCGQEHPWSIAYCSRSGSPRVPWLEPDVGARLAALAADGVGTVVIVPVGFVSDHMEVIQDLDREALARAEKLGLTAVRAGTVGADPRFVRMIAELVEERRDPGAPRRALSAFGPFPDVCPTDCCSSPAAEDRRPAVAGTSEDALGRGRFRRGAGKTAVPGGTAVPAGLGAIGGAGRPGRARGPGTDGGRRHLDDGRGARRAGILDEDPPAIRPARPDRHAT
ncbi:MULTISPECIES: ferrochelatase [unclassified Pseudofrankia]|uniref:ferrochelatase n=1 Tax=unclassified Pseudofrankia TaxID=2994372 RepID=UPI001F519366|nr:MULTISPECIES: ferrochelatase [unclassified Pseudofrankia]MDT3442048.1 ferrochelatase [Pseudofrankia sp. BMG5.37]